MIYMDIISITCIVIILYEIRIEIMKKLVVNKFRHK